MAGTDTFRGVSFQSAYSVLLALEVLEGAAEVLQVEGNIDVVDASLENPSGESVLSVQAKTKAQPYQWTPKELTDPIVAWLGSTPSDGEQFEFVTDGTLGPEVVDDLEPSLRRAADNALTEADRIYLTGKGIDPDDPAAARIRISSRLSSGRDLLEKITIRVMELRQRVGPLSVEEARDVVNALFTELVLSAGEAEVERRRISRAKIGELVGVELDLIDDAESWSKDLEEGYRKLLLEEDPDPGWWTLLDITELDRTAALAYVTAPASGGISQSMPATKLIDLGGSALLQGPAGAGKSTTLSMLSASALEKGQVPIPLRLSTYTPGALRGRLHRAIEATLGRTLARGTVDVLLSRKSTIVLVDGAGELVPEQREAAIADLQALRDEHADGARFFVAGRSRMPFTALSLGEYTLQGLDHERRLKIAGGLLDDGEAHTAAIERDLGEVAENPLLFTMAVALRGRGVEAVTRTELLAAFVSGLENRPEGTSLSPAARAALEAACFDLRLEARYSAEEWSWLEKFAAKRESLIEKGVLGEEAPAADALLEELLKMGLLRPLGDPSELGLLHDLFCDWFASEALRKNSAELTAPLPESLEEAVVFLAEAGELDPGELRIVAESPIAAMRAARVHREADADPGRAQELWELMSSNFGDSVRGPLAGLDLRSSQEGRLVQLVDPGNEPSAEDPLRGVHLSASYLDRVSPIGMAAALWSGAMRLALSESAWEMPTPPVEGDEGAVEMLRTAVKARIAARDELLARIAPGIADRLRERIGPLGMRAWVMPAEEHPSIPGEPPITENIAHYAEFGDDVDIRLVAGPEDVPENAATGQMAVRSYISSGPVGEARAKMRDALGDLVEGFDD